LSDAIGVNAKTTFRNQLWSDQYSEKFGTADEGGAEERKESDKSSPESIRHLYKAQQQNSQVGQLD